MDKKIVVIGYGNSGRGDAIFIARTYSSNVTLLTLGQGMKLNGDQRSRIAEHHVEVIEDPIAALEMSERLITALRVQSGKEHHFGVLYSALGMKVRSELALSLGAKHDEAGAIITGEHNRTSVKGLYAAGDVVRGLSQIVVGMAMQLWPQQISIIVVSCRQRKSLRSPLLRNICQASHSNVAAPISQR